MIDVRLRSSRRLWCLVDVYRSSEIINVVMYDHLWGFLNRWNRNNRGTRCHRVSCRNIRLSYDICYTWITEESWEPPISDILAVPSLLEEPLEEVLLHSSVHVVKVDVLVRGGSRMLDETLENENIQYSLVTQLVVEVVQVDLWVVLQQLRVHG